MAKSSIIKAERPEWRPSHPGDYAAEAIKALGIRPAQAAREMGIDKMNLSRVLRGLQPVTPEIAVRFGRYFGNGDEIWMSLQSAVDLFDARARLKDAVGGIPVRKPPEAA